MLSCKSPRIVSYSMISDGHTQVIECDRSVIYSPRTPAYMPHFEWRSVLVLLPDEVQSISVIC